MLPSVPGYNSRSISGICRKQESLLKMSLFKSSAFWTWNVILLAFCEMPPPCLISVDLRPQNSQLNAMMMISLKYGMVHWHILTVPILKQPGHGLGIVYSSFSFWLAVWLLCSSNGLLKSIALAVISGSALPASFCAKALAFVCSLIF